ncbi:MAG: NAD(+) synthase, partial [Acidobacteriota bacterium]
MSDSSRRFDNLYSHDFVRVAIGIPRVAVADPRANAEHTIELLDAASRRHACLVLFPELGLSAYSCEDLFQQRALQDGALAALERVVEASRDLAVVGVVGVPLVIGELLYNCAAVFAGGRLLGVVPKTFLPSYREFYELRQFTPADRALVDEVDLCGQSRVPFGVELLFRLAEQPWCCFHVEMC